MSIKVTTYVNQALLKPLPVPSLLQSASKYLRSLEPILEAHELENSKRIVEEFIRPGGEGEALQKKLEQRAEEKWKKGENWLEEWWTKYAYLFWPDPICINSNVYVICEDPGHTFGQAYQAAKMIRGLVEYKIYQENELLPPEYMDKQKKIPLDMNQYTKLFTTVRHPGPEGQGDSQITLKPSNKIVVLSNSQFYLLNLYENGRPLTVKDIELQIGRILLDSSSHPRPRNGVGVATATTRPEWARLRGELLKDPQNKLILQEIDSCLLVVCLDENSPQDRDSFAFHVIAGDANNRWFDKVIQLIIFRNGKVGLNVEHSPLDAPCLNPALTYMDKVAESIDQNYASIRSSPDVPPPAKLQWNLSEEILQGLKKAEEFYESNAQDVDIKVLPCREAGVKNIQSLNVSPDAFIQMAIQLAHFKMYREGVATYETGQTRKFFHGRTDTVRSYSRESKEFTEAMLSPETTPARRLELFQKAIKAHVDYMKDATNGQAFDRHFLGLKLLAMQEMQEGSRKVLPAIFTDPAFSKSSTWKLSTSNIPGAITYSGGFGNVVPDGYGVCYISRPQETILSICSKKSCPRTNSTRFRELLQESICDMRNLVLGQSKL